MPALVVALALTFTRSAWVGACVGVGLLLLLRDLRLIGVLPVVAALFIAVAPAAVTDRAYSMFNLKDPTNRDRLAMVQAGDGNREALPAHRRRSERRARGLPELPADPRRSIRRRRTCTTCRCRSPPNAACRPWQSGSGSSPRRRSGCGGGSGTTRSRYLAAAGLGALGGHAGGRVLRVQFR